MAQIFCQAGIFSVFEESAHTILSISLQFSSLLSCVASRRSSSSTLFIGLHVLAPHLTVGRWDRREVPFLETSNKHEPNQPCQIRVGKRSVCPWSPSLPGSNNEPGAPGTYFDILTIAST